MRKNKRVGKVRYWTPRPLLNRVDFMYYYI